MYLWLFLHGLYCSALLVHAQYKWSHQDTFLCTLNLMSLANKYPCILSATAPRSATLSGNGQTSFHSTSGESLPVPPTSSSPSSGDSTVMVPETLLMAGVGTTHCPRVGADTRVTACCINALNVGIRVIWKKGEEHTLKFHPYLIHLSSGRGSKSFVWRPLLFHYQSHTTAIFSFPVCASLSLPLETVFGLLN